MWKYICIYQSILIPSWENVHELLVWWINCYCSTWPIFWIFIYWSSSLVVSNQCTSSEVSAGDVPNSEPGWESGLLSRDAEFSKAGTLLFTDAEEMTALEGLSPFHKKTKFLNYCATCPSLHHVVLILFTIIFNGPFSLLLFIHRVPVITIIIKVFVGCQHLIFHFTDLIMSAVVLGLFIFIDLQILFSTKLLTYKSVCSLFMGHLAIVLFRTLHFF